MQYLTTTLEIKSLKGREIIGHGSVFGNVDLGGDIVVKGAFANTLNEHKSAGTMPKLFWMHDPKLVLGKWIDMHEDDKGLSVHGVLAPTPLGDEIKTHLEMGSIDGLSMGYGTRKATYDKAGNRLLKDVYLGEVSVVSMAMNPLATVEHMKSRLSAKGEYVPTIREWERILREHGCSRRVAEMAARKMFGDDDGMSDLPDDETPRDEDEFKALMASIQKLTGQRYGAALKR